MVENTAADRPFQGKIALVTGAAGGLGGALATALAEQGAIVAGCDIDPSRIHIGAFDAGEVFAHQIDLTDVASIQRCLAEVVNQHGEVDILVHAAIRHFIGDDGHELRAFVDHTPEQVMQTLAVAITGPTLLTQLVAKGMVNRKSGKIALTGSMHRQGSAGMVMYAAAKAYVNALARGLFLELRDYNVTAHVANPGGMHTAMHGHRYPWMLDPSLVADVIVGQLAMPSTVAMLSFEMVPHDVDHPDGIF